MVVISGNECRRSCESLGIHCWGGCAFTFAVCVPTTLHGIEDCFYDSGDVVPWLDSPFYHVWQGHTRKDNASKAKIIHV